MRHKQLRWLLLALLLLLACGGQQSESEATDVLVEGPALVLFYTDN